MKAVATVAVEVRPGTHPAGPNFGDLFGYALARTSGELLFKGDHFARTDTARVP